MKKMLLVGAGSHALGVAETIQQVGEYSPHGMVTDNPEKHGKTYCGVPVLGALEMMEELFTAGVHYAHLAFFSGGKGLKRKKLYQKLLETGFMLPTLRHPSSLLSGSASLGQACYMGIGSIVQPATLVHENSVIATGAIVEEQCNIGQNVIVGPRCVIGAGVKIGDDSMIGMGAMILPGVQIGKYATVAAGAVVHRNIENGRRVAGVPARPIGSPDEDD